MSLVGDLVLFLPAVCRCKDGELVGYTFAVPQRKVLCTDLRRSEVTSWVIPEKVVHGYAKIAFFEDCLGPFEIARDSLVTSLTVVGESLRDELAGGRYAALWIVPPDELPSRPY